MKNSLKKLTALMLSAVLLASVTIVSAAEPAQAPQHPLVQNNLLEADGSVDLNADEIQPRFAILTHGTVGITPTNRVIRYQATAECLPHTSNCGITGSLQRWNGSSWVEFRSWEVSKDSAIATLDKYVSVPAGDYCGVAYFSATFGGKTEFTQLATAKKTVS